MTQLMPINMVNRIAFVNFPNFSYLLSNGQEHMPNKVLVMDKNLEFSISYTKKSGEHIYNKLALNDYLTSYNPFHVGNCI